MAKDEFSVNELEPVRNNNLTEETTEQVNNVSDASLLNQEARHIDEVANQDNQYTAEEYEGPTIKEVLVNSINPDYQGPTAKEIVVNSVKVDNTKKKNMVGLVVLIIVLVLVGFIVTLEMLSEDTKPETDYLSDLPKWSLTYHKYIAKEYKNLISYELVFLDLDFDDKAEAIISYKENNEEVYEVFDVLGAGEVSFKVDNLSDLLMMYSFTDRTVTWYINTSVNDNDMNLIDVKKRIANGTDYEVNLSLDTLAAFKSDHFTLSYEVLYNKMSFRTYDKDFAAAVLSYEEEKDNVVSIVNNVKDKYDDSI